MTASDEKVENGVIHAMVVDDSAVIRGLITRMLEADPGVNVVASVGNGQLAVNQITRKPGDIDVVILDIEMPVMDGLTALPLILKADSNIKVIMASTLTKKNAEISIKAMSLGATDYVPKPSTARELSGEDEFRRDLVAKVRSLGIARRKAAMRATRPAPASSTPSSSAAPKDDTAWRLNRGKDFTLRDAGKSKPDIIAVGSSTGGPQALFEFFKGLPKTLNLPIVVTQHMPATFTSILAEHITRMSGWPCKEAANGDPITAGQILLAPGDYHMTVVQKGAQRVIALNQDPPENFCRPAVDPMLRSIAKVYGSHVLAVILTGMGNDGAKGGREVVESGGTVIAQDEATSVVWGMPGAAAAMGICSAVLPIGELPGYVTNYVSRRR